MSNRGTEAPSSTTLECCMCGDYGLPDQLFRCKICLFRFQHRYCSDLYPKAESYRFCNWCLKRKGRKIMEAQHEEDRKNKKSNSRDDNDELVGVKAQRGSSLQLHLQNPMMKKQRSSPPEQSSSTARKRIISNGCLEEKLKRTKSEEMIPKTKTGITKQVFRGKVQRYKLLDEVSS